MERNLSKKEKQLLLDANLTPKADWYISGLWSRREEPAESSFWMVIVGNIIGMLFMATLIFVLGAKVFHWASIPEGFENVVFFFIWLLFVIMFPVINLFRYLCFDETKATSIFSYNSLSHLVRRNMLIRYYGRLASLSLVGLIIFRGEITTAVALAVSWIFSFLLLTAMKGKIKIALKKIK
jgi:hypothetical protein